MDIKGWIKKHKKEIITYAVFIIGTLALGFASSIFVRIGMDSYRSLQKPPLSPPEILFPIAWTILYTLMAVGMATVYLKADPISKKASLKIYFFQLAVNLLWPLFFFTLGWYFFSFLWIALLIVLVIAMIIIFYGTSKPAALLQLPYLAWLTFAAYLNLAVFALNS
jgi:tryptophan-rich sensory protein